MNEAPIPVMQFCNTTVRGGAEEHILTLLWGLDRKDFRLHLVCSPAVADALRSDLPTDVELLPLFYPAPSHAAAADGWADGFASGEFRYCTRICLLAACALRPLEGCAACR